jgi:CRP-like cAMP-binding protein
MRIQLGQTTPPTGNLLIDALPDEDRGRLVEKMRFEKVGLRQVLAQPELPMKTVHFPLGAVISLITTLSDGSAMETAMVGREGIVGITVFLGDSTVSNVWAIAQVPGAALSLSAEEFERQASDSPKLAATLLAYTNALLIQEAQAVACARLHSVEHRMSRLLLMTEDRAGAEQFPLTQEGMSAMLGVHRPSVTLTAITLQERGLIRYRRGWMTILDRGGLINATCECYATMTLALGRLTGAPGPDNGPSRERSREVAA